MTTTEHDRGHEKAEMVRLRLRLNKLLTPFCKGENDFVNDFVNFVYLQPFIEYLRPSFAIFTFSRTIPSNDISDINDINVFVTHFVNVFPVKHKANTNAKANMNTNVFVNKLPPL